MYLALLLHLFELALVAASSGPCLFNASKLSLILTHTRPLILQLLDVPDHVPLLSNGHAFMGHVKLHSLDLQQPNNTIC